MVLIVDFRPERSNKLKELIGEERCLVIAQVWHLTDTQDTPRNWGEIAPRVQISSDTDVVFIHASDEVQPYWRNFLLDKCAAKWVILYSGDGYGVTNDLLIKADPEVSLEEHPNWH